jgi:ribonuclease P/MRP protein subunit POP8
MAAIDGPAHTGNSAQPLKKRSRPSKAQTLSQFTIRNPRWSYAHLQHLSSSTQTPADLDAVTAHLHLSAAMSQFLGLYGSAVPIELLKLEGQDVWIRIPADDRSALVAAVGGWVSRQGEGWRVKGWSSWGVDATAGRTGGQDLFAD